MVKQKLCQVSDIPLGGVKEFQISSFDIAVFNCEGKFYAIDRKCTHFKGNLAKGVVENKTVKCPLHGAVYSLETGELLNQPGTIAGWFKKGHNTNVYKLSIKKDEISIDLPSIKDE